MSYADRERWNEKYATAEIPVVVQPAPFLVEAVRGLRPGDALEVACGLGHNAIWLAQQGWRVTAVDISAIALEKAATLAQRAGAMVDWRLADLDEAEWPADSYDLITVFRFLDRGSLPGRLTAALRPGGRLVYETFTVQETQRPGAHCRNPAFTLQPGELLRMFPELTVEIDFEGLWGGAYVAQFRGSKESSLPGAANGGDA